ncbi:MAG: nitroreductase [Parvularcula sp.]|jgi:nitroreductase|nr:nitroreductase [Parvularcula sp.]
MSTPTPLHPVAVDAAIRGRRSSRAFLPESLPNEILREILTLASRAPSGTNMQPWKVYVLGKPQIAQVAEAIAGSGIRADRAHWDDYRYYPDFFPEPYLRRRRQVGAALYELLGIGRRDVTRMRSHFERNFRFFGAPTGLFVTIDRRLEKGSWLDLGMFIQTLLIAAQARGIDSCVQAAFAPFHRQIRPLVGMRQEEVLVCGIALGRADPSRPENKMRTDRAPLDEWVVDLTREQRSALDCAA